MDVWGKALFRLIVVIALLPPLLLAAKHIEMSSVRTDAPKSPRRQASDKDSESKLPLMLPADSPEAS